MSLLPLLVFALPPTEVQPAPDYLSLTAMPLMQDEVAEPSAWTGSVNVGGSHANGKSTTTSLYASFDAVRETAANRWTTGMWWNYGGQSTTELVDPTPAAPGSGDEFFDEKSDVTTRNWGGKVQYDKFLDPKLYWYANGGTETDDIALLQLRLTGGLGVGYQFHADETFSLNGEAGLSGVHEDLEMESPNEFVAARLAYNAAYQMSETTKFTQSAELLPSLKDSDDWTGTLDTTMDVSMTATMSLRLQHILRYDNTPARGTLQGGDGAPSADNQVILGIAWSF